MRRMRFLVAGVGIGLCLVTMAKADDDDIPNLKTVVKPVTVKHVIVFTGSRDRVVYVRPAYPVQSVRSKNLAPSPVEAKKTHQNSSANYAAADRQTSNHVSRVAKPGHVDVSQAEQKSDRETKPADVDHKIHAKQPQNDDAPDELTAQAQREQELRLAEPGGIPQK